MALPKYHSSDFLITILRKILQALTGTAEDAGIAEILAGSGVTDAWASFADVTIAAAGTAQQLTALTNIGNGILITAFPSNNGNIYVGDSAVDPTSRKGVILTATGQVTIKNISNLNLVWVDGDTTGEGFSIQRL